MKHTLKYAAIACLFAVSANAASDHPMVDKVMSKMAVKTPVEFVELASEANLVEIKSSELALQKSKNESIRKFAQQMIDDHSKAGANLNKVVATTSVNGKSVATSLNKPDQEMYDKLAAINDDQMFDDKYVILQNDAHKQAVSLFAFYSKTGTDAALRKFATDTLPTLEMHQMHVKPLYEAVSKDEQKGKM